MKKDAADIKEECKPQVRGWGLRLPGQSRIWGSCYVWLPSESGKPHNNSTYNHVHNIAINAKKIHFSNSGSHNNNNRANPDGGDALLWNSPVYILRLPFLDGGWGELLKRRWPSAESIPWQEYVWHTWHQPEDPAWKSGDDMPRGYWRGISFTTFHANTLRYVTQASGTRDHSQCSDGKKLEPGRRCDGVNDCAGGEDEINCHEVNLWRHISMFQINPSSHIWPFTNQLGQDIY